MSNLRFNKIKAQTPIAILVHGGNRIGYLTAKTLIDQGCYVVIIDKFNSNTKKYLSELKKSELFDFFDFKGFNSLFKNIKRFDYMFYFLNSKVEQKDFDSKEFLNETKTLEESLLNTKKNNAKFSLITSLALNRELSNRVNNIKLASPSPYSNIELQKYCETLAAEFKDKSNINIRILRLGTVIGKGTPRVDNDIFDGLLKDSTQRNQITIKGEGLDIHSLIHEQDATYGILKLSFSDKTKGEVISLANKNNYTTLSLAYKLLELNTEAQAIRFVENTDDDFVIQDLYVPAPHATRYDWSQQVMLEDALIEQLQTYYESANKSWDFEKKEKTTRKKDSGLRTKETKLGELVSSILKPFKREEKGERKSFDHKKTLTTLGIISSILLVTYFLVYPIVGTILGLVIINNTARSLTTSLLELDEQNSHKNVALLEKNIDRVSKSVQRASWMFNITGQKDLYDNTSQLIQGARYTAQGASELVYSIYPLSQYVQDFQPALDFQTSTPATTREYREHLEAIKESAYKIDEASYKISLASEVINNIDTTVFPNAFQEKILEIKELITQLKTGTETFEDVVVFLPELLGVEERKRYLILLQNESELRSTGGWLTSYGVIGIEGGQLRELFVDDIYNADGTLKIQNKKYTPPRSMVTALEVTNWPFSLVNWSPDLQDTLRESEIYIKDLGKGNSIDGLITIDIAFIQKMLDKWGGIEVPGETELITSENLYTKIFEMHEEFTPGSTQKTTFLANLANEIVKKLLTLNIAELIEIGDVFEESLEEKHLQATFVDRNAYNFFNDRNWSGSLDSRYNDAPIAIDWNWGGNKANLYLDKSYNLNVTVKDIDTVDFSYSLTIENSSSKNEYPEGDYINYQRVYIPPNATVLKIEGFEENKYNIYKESGFKVIGGWFNTPIQSSNTLEISYRLERSSDNLNFPLVKQDENVFLDINLFKQAGEKKYAYRIDLSYPSTWNLEKSGNLNSISNQLSGRFELNQDLEFPIGWRIPN